MGGNRIMAIFYNTVTHEYPRHIEDLEVLGWNRDYSALPENWVEVFISPMPTEIEEHQIIEPGLTPTFQDGKWYTTWIIRNMTQQEIDHISDIESGI